MANYATLKAAINAVIKANGNKEITGTVLNETLTAMVNSLGANYQFAGVATPSTNPGIPDQNVFYLAGKAGTYTNFNSIVLPDGVSILRWNGSWSSETVLADDGVFDISAYKATGGTLATFADLSAALDGGNNIPSALRKGGMMVKFIQGTVQSSDNKYVQYRLMSASFSTQIKDWLGEIEVKNGKVFVVNEEQGELANIGKHYGDFPFYGEIYYDNGSYHFAKRSQPSEYRYQLIQVQPEMTSISCYAKFGNAISVAIAFLDIDQAIISASQIGSGNAGKYALYTETIPSGAFWIFVGENTDGDIDSDKSYWAFPSEEKTLEEKFKEEEDKINAIYSEKYNDFTEVGEVYYYNGYYHFDKGGSTDWRYKQIDANGVKKVKLKTEPSSNYLSCSITFFDSSNNVIFALQRDTIHSYYEADVPNGTSYIVVTTENVNIGTSWYQVIKDSVNVNLEKIEDRLSSLENGTIIPSILANLPVSDGTDVSIGDAYIDSTTSVIKVRLT